jgi:hypothetical protein
MKWIRPNWFGPWQARSAAAEGIAAGIIDAEGKTSSSVPPHKTELHN